MTYSNPLASSYASKGSWCYVGSSSSAVDLSLADAASLPQGPSSAEAGSRCKYLRHVCQPATAVFITPRQTTTAAPSCVRLDALLPPADLMSVDSSKLSCRGFQLCEGDEDGLLFCSFAGLLSPHGSPLLGSAQRAQKCSEIRNFVHPASEHFELGPLRPSLVELASAGSLPLPRGSARCDSSTTFFGAVRSTRHGSRFSRW